MFDNITKEEFDISFYVGDKLEEYIFMNKKSKDNNNMFVNILFGILLLGLLVFLYFINKKNNKETKPIDEKIECYNNICYRTL